MMLRLGLVLALAIGGLGLGGSLARASCVEPELELIWSYPAHGDTGVPTNATFWALSSVWGALPVVTLDGAAVDAVAVTTSAVRIDPGVLAPETEHVLRLEYPSSEWEDSDGGPRVLTLAFRTGSGLAAAAPLAAVSGEEVAPEHEQAYSGCVGELIHAQGCLDTGPRDLHTFHASAPGAIAWIAKLEGGSSFENDTLWPASCGQPRLSLFSYQQQPTCFELRAIGQGGRLGEAARFCSEPPDAGLTPAADSGMPRPHMRPAEPAGGSTRDDDSCACSAPGGVFASGLGRRALFGLAFAALLGRARARRRPPCARG